MFFFMNRLIINPNGTKQEFGDCRELKETM
jgi:hypothetical protein